MADSLYHHKNEVLIVIPYLAKEAQGRELEYAVAGWRKYFGEPHRIVIVGDWHPVVETGDDITFIECPRVEPIVGQYTPHIDHVHKFRKVHEAFPDSEGFIYTCDDIYAVNGFDMLLVKAPKVIPGGIDFDPKSPNPWRRDAMKTKCELQKLGYPDRNFVCHLPVWYEWDKIEAIWDKWDCDHNSYVVEYLYFNIHFPVADAFIIDEDSWLRCEVRNTKPDPARLERAFKEKIWINNSPDGYVDIFERMLGRYYGLQ